MRFTDTQQSDDYQDEMMSYVAMTTFPCREFGSAASVSSHSLMRKLSISASDQDSCSGVRAEGIFRWP